MRHCINRTIVVILISTLVAADPAWTVISSQSVSPQTASKPSAQIFEQQAITARLVEAYRNTFNQPAALTALHDIRPYRNDIGEDAEPSQKNRTQKQKEFYGRWYTAYRIWDGVGGVFFVFASICLSRSLMQPTYHYTTAQAVWSAILIAMSAEAGLASLWPNCLFSLDEIKEQIKQERLNQNFGDKIKSLRTYVVLGTAGFIFALVTTPLSTIGTLFHAAVHFLWRLQVPLEVLPLVLIMMIGSIYLNRYKEEFELLPPYKMRTKLLDGVHSVILAPSAEEFLFRGILFNVLKWMFAGLFHLSSLLTFVLPLLHFSVHVQTGALIAILISAEIFYHLHGNKKNWGQWVAGVIYGYVYYSTGSLFTSMMMHAIWNGIAHLMTFVSLIPTWIRDPASRTIGPFDSEPATPTSHLIVRAIAGAA
jgi:membrane protease YdiL (CAAX protease family)